MNTAHQFASQIDRELVRVTASIDQLAEMTSRGKPTMNRRLIEAARSVDSARTAVRLVAIRFAGPTASEAEVAL